ncbi:metallopeptidase TldD-related protein [Fulvivirga lutea]|uniref:Uncharacterized protein n=1 Tax=Fulvivirga lutea TaxID=2810512 RepID=A0A975A236_9BACT|nr:metallopeptidase TldD-related protein [Fulvivirga lutea]QSE98875.1 hypothetical protein JR347_07280 [Fulvivirga lutea]
MKYFILIVLTSITVSSYSQQVDSLKLAMQDELARSIKELDHKEYGAPFYIAYDVNDYTNTIVSASFGGLINSNQFKQRNINARVLVGDYEFNDESFSADNVEPHYSADDMLLPVDNDYHGIRRSLWSVTDKIFKTAGEVFVAHKQDLKDKKKKISEVPHLKFGKQEAVKITTKSDRITIEKSELESQILSISREFLKYPEISVSSVVLNLYEGKNYFINTEGTDVYEEQTIVTLVMSCAYQNEEGEYFYDQKKYLSKSPKQLFTDTDFSSEVKEMSELVLTLKDAPVFEDSYEGPVIFMESAVPALFSSIIPQFVPKPLEEEDNFYGYSASTSLERKIGKQEFSKSLSLTLKPSLTEYKDMQLLGSYSIDNEGVKPDDEIVLVKKGVVNDLMVSRNYTGKEFQPNGTSSSQGVLHIEIDNTVEGTDDLQQLMLKKINDEDLTYGLIITKFFNDQFFHVKKVLPNGETEYYRNARLMDFDKKSLRKIVAASQEETVTNETNLNSYIAPKAVLIDDVEIEPARIPKPKKKPALVESPLHSIN